MSWSLGGLNSVRTANGQLQNTNPVIFTIERFLKDHLYIVCLTNIDL
jgi:hypothetical protein